MTTNKNKNYWTLNWILCAVVFVVLSCCLGWEYFFRGYPTEPSWLEEVCKYLFLFPILTAICWTIAFVPFQTLAAKIAKKREEK